MNRGLAPCTIAHKYFGYRLVSECSCLKLFNVPNQVKCSGKKATQSSTHYYHCSPSISHKIKRKPSSDTGSTGLFSQAKPMISAFEGTHRTLSSLSAPTNTMPSNRPHIIPHITTHLCERAGEEHLPWAKNNSCSFLCRCRLICCSVTAPNGCCQPGSSGVTALVAHCLPCPHQCKQLLEQHELDCWVGDENH